jgi:hypothetical protein
LGFVPLTPSGIRFQEGAFIATVKAFPDGRAIKDERIDIRGTAFWTELPSPQDSLLFLGCLLYSHKQR